LPFERHGHFTNKRKTKFSKEDSKEISPILIPQLKKFGYAETEEWKSGI
jgi:hypothetical protein